MQYLSDMRVAIDPIWPWPVTGAAMLALVALVFFIYPPRVRHLTPFWRRTLIGLRVLAALMIALAMLRPALEFRETDSESLMMVVLGDVSRSMQTQDAPGGATRRDALIKTLAENQEKLKAINETIAVRYFEFSDELAAAETPRTEADGEQTAIGAALDAVLRQADTNRILSVTVMSDGAQRALPPRDADPREKARLFGERGISINAIAFGSSNLSGSALDLAVEDMLVDPYAFEKQTIPVNASVRVLGAAGQKLTVRLLTENRSGKRPGEKGTMEVPPASRDATPVKQIEAGSASEVIPVELSFVPDRPGEYKIAFEVVPIDGELKTSNNRQETLITVQGGGIRVAYFDRFLRPEHKFLAATNASSKIQLDLHLVRTGNEFGQTEIDSKLFDPREYDAYIIGDLPASVFGAARLRKLTSRVYEGAGLMMTGGRRSFGPGGYADTPLADLLPVAMSPADESAEGDYNPALHHESDLQMLPTERGLQHFVMRLDGTPEREDWQDLPPLRGANRLSPKTDFAEVLAESAEGDPLLIAQQAGVGRVMAFGGDTTYLWHLAGHGEEHQRFWRQVILWLTRKELDSEQPVWVRVDPRNFSPGQTVPLQLGARREDGTPITEAQLTVEVIDPNGERQEVPVRAADQQFAADFSDTQVPGDYWVRVTGRVGEKVIGTAETRFIVDERDLELDNPAADPGLLEELALLTGGRFLPPEEFGGYLSRLLEEGPSQSELTKVTRVSLWDNWPFLLCFVGVMSLEWVVRKRRGLV